MALNERQARYDGSVSPQIAAPLRIQNNRERYRAPTSSANVGMLALRSFQEFLSDSDARAARNIRSIVLYSSYFEMYFL